MVSVPMRAKGFRFSMLKAVVLAIAMILPSLAVFSSSASALTCQQVRQLTAVYLKMHYSFNHFDDELSGRTLDLFIRSWDPGKLYFYKSDIDEFKKAYDKQLDDMILSANCAGITKIINVFGKRFEERQKDIPALVDLKHDFKVDEYMELDRKKFDYAQTQEEIKERWRKRIKFQLLQLNETLKDMNKSKDKLKKRYELATKRHNEETTDTVYTRFLNAFSSGLDPHSEYMSPDSLEDFRIQTRLSLEGIGAVLRSDDGFTVIQSLVPGGAAAKEGELKVEDKIIAVAQEKGEPVDVIDMDLRDVVKLIRGTGGTTVRLTIARDESGKTVQKIVPIVREKVQLTDRTAKSQVVKATVDVNGKKSDINVGILTLPSFYIDFEGQHNKVDDYRSSARDMLVEIEKLRNKKIDAMVLDLRTNGGGSLTESIKVAGLFFDKGPVVQIKESNGNVYPNADTDGVTFYDGPLVVLMGRQSASASEIFAGAIADYQRGLLVGDDHTFGKGTVQNLNDIGEKLGATKVTISKFYRPSGSSTQLKGVDSDISLPGIIPELEIGEKYYDYALPWDKIQSVSYKPFNYVKPYVADLKKLSKERISKDGGFKKIGEEIAEFKKNEAERSRVSLREDKQDKKVSEKKKDKDKKKTGEDGEEGEDLPLVEDYHLQESVRIAVDYSQLMNKKKTGKISIPAFASVEIAGTSKKAAVSKAAKAGAEEVKKK